MLLLVREALFQLTGGEEGIQDSKKGRKQKAKKRKKRWGSLERSFNKTTGIKKEMTN